MSLGSPAVAILSLALLAPASPSRAARRDLEVSFRSRDVTLAGTLSLPPGPARPPVAIFISGDGPQDRDGEPGGGGFFPALADSLVASGIAVLRHDDRGAGRSTRPAGPPSYRALLDDTRAAVAFVRAHRELDRARVALVGHSEGAKSAAVLAAGDSGIAAIVLLAGATAVNVDSLLMEQARATPDGPAPRFLDVVAAARAGARASAPGDLTDWIREHLEIAPRSVLGRVRCPVLIVQGGADHLVAPHHAQEAAQVLRAGGNRRVEVRTYDGLSHVFNRWTPGGAASPEARRTDPIVPRDVAAWLRATLAERSSAGGS